MPSRYDLRNDLKNIDGRRIDKTGRVKKVKASIKRFMELAYVEPWKAGESCRVGRFLCHRHSSVVLFCKVFPLQTYAIHFSR
jgi:hypothetical protein